MRIELKNKTAFRDEDLREIIRVACSKAGARTMLLRVTIVHARTDRVSGWATYPRLDCTGAMKLRIPRLSAGATPVERAFNHVKLVELLPRVAKLVLHEAMHLAGARHPDMTEEQLTCTMPTPWANSMLLRIKEIQPAVDVESRKAAARSDRFEHAQAMLAKAVTRRKLATTLEKKWARRVRSLSK